MFWRLTREYFISDNVIRFVRRIICRAKAGSLEVRCRGGVRALPFPSRELSLCPLVTETGR
jgi:hypothetical protein